MHRRLLPSVPVAPFCLSVAIEGHSAVKGPGLMHQLLAYLHLGHPPAQPRKVSILRYVVHIFSYSVEFNVFARE